MRVLIADDNVDAASTLRALLEMWGHDVQEVHDGERSLEIAGAFRPHVMLLDIGMPKLNGYEVAQEMRRREPEVGKPILVAITGWGQEQDRTRAREAGFDVHLTKPLDPMELEELLKQHGSLLNGQG